MDLHHDWFIGAKILHAQWIKKSNFKSESIMEKIHSVTQFVVHNYTVSNLQFGVGFNPNSKWDIFAIFLHFLWSSSLAEKYFCMIQWSRTSLLQQKVLKCASRFPFHMNQSCSTWKPQMFRQVILCIFAFKVSIFKLEKLLVKSSF